MSIEVNCVWFDRYRLRYKYFVYRGLVNSIIRQKMRVSTHH